MNNQSTRNLQSDPPPIAMRRSSSHVTMDRLNEIEHDDCLLSRLLCLHHLRTALSYLCNVDTSNIIKYNQEYEQFLRTTKLRDIVLARISQSQREGEGEREELKEVNVLGEAFWLQRVPLAVVILLSLMAGGLSVVVIYYQQTLAKYIITLTSDQQYKWFGIIVGCIFARFLLFNYLSALANNVAVNVKVGLQNMFMRAIFFLDHGGQQLCMHKLRFPAIEALVEAITFLPYALVALSTIIGVVVLLFNLNGVYGWVFLGIVLFCLVCHSLLMLAVYLRLRNNEQVKEATRDESKGVFRSLIPLIFDRISKNILKRVLKAEEESLNCDRLYNFCYTVSQFLSDASCLVPILVYYGINHDGVKAMPILNTYLSAVYLGMLYFPFKVLVFGSYSLIRGLEQYRTMMEAFQKHMRQRTMRDLHVAQFHQEPQVHAYPDNLGDCFNYSYDPEQAPHLPVHHHQLKRSLSNAFLDLETQPGEAVMAYFSTANRKQMEDYIQEVVRSIPFDKTVALISEDHFILPESFQQNVCLYSEHNEARFREVLRVVGLGDLLPEIEALGGKKLSYRMAKFYPWHSCRLELARALYNTVDYLFINRHVFLEDKQLLQAVMKFRREEGKITFIANSWRLDTFPLADRLVFFYGDRRENGTLKELEENKESALNEVLAAVSGHGMKLQVEGEGEGLGVVAKAPHFVAVVARERGDVQLSRSSYFRFFNLAHWGASIVVILGLLSPVGFKVYMNWLIGQSTKKVIYPDILIFAILSLFFVFLRGLILALYFRSASAGLFRKLVVGAGRLSGDQLVRVLKEKDEGVERDFRKLDSSLVVCFQLGMSVTLEMAGSMVIVAIGQPIVLAMVVPLMILIVVVNLLFARMERALLLLRSRHEQHMKTFVEHCTTKAEALFRYGKYAEVQERFHQLHRVHVMFVSNELWALSGMRMLGELVILVAVTVFLVIMIETQSKQLTNLPMVSLGVSLFINMNFSYRFNLKTLAILDAQTLAITSCLNFYRKVQQGEEQREGEDIPKEEDRREVAAVEEIEWRQVQVQVGDSKCGISLRLRKGDRAVVDADSRALAALPFYFLRRQAFSSDHITGEILINGQSAHSVTVPGLFYLHSQAVLPTTGTVLQACQAWAEVSQEECEQRLGQFFAELKIRPLFQLKDTMGGLHQGLQQVLMVFRVAKFQQCSVLVMVSAFDCLDVVTRIAVEKYLMAQPIPILISINNHPQLAALYSRRLTFTNGSFQEPHPNREKKE